MINLNFKNFLSSPLHRKWQIIAILFLLSYALLAINSGCGFIGVIFAPDFPLTLLFTFVVATLLTIYIHSVNQMLERRFPHRKFIHKRLMFQMAIGIIMRIGFEFTLASAYFMLKNGGTLVSDHLFDVDFILIVTFIILLNGFYMYAIDVFQYKTGILEKYQQEILPALEELDYLRKIYRIKMIRKAPITIKDANLSELGVDRDQIACLYKLNNEVIMHYFDSPSTKSKKTIKRLFATLPKEDYFQINPYCFYHRLVIFKGEDLESRRIRLILRHPFNHFVDEKQRIVSQSRSVNFKCWFKGD